MYRMREALQLIIHIFCVSIEYMHRRFVALPELNMEVV